MAITPRSAFQAYFMIGSESTWGTPVTPNKDVGYIQNHSIEESNNLTRIRAVSTREVQTDAAGRYTVNGSVEAVYQHGRILNYVFGQTNHASNSSDWIHTFSVNNSALPSFTAEGGWAGTANTAYRIEGCKVGSATLGIDVDGQFTVRFDYTGQQSSVSAAVQTYTGSSLPVYSAYQATVSTGTSGGEAVVAEARSFELTINNDLQPVGTLGSRTIEALTEGGRNYEYRMSLAFANEAEHGRFINGVTPSTGVLSTHNMVFQVLKDTTALGSGKRGLFISLGSCTYQAATTPTPVNGVVYQDFVGYAVTMNNASAWDNISSSSW